MAGSFDMLLSNILGDTGDAIRQRLNPVFNSAGEQIGSADNLEAFCSGKWYLFKGATRPPNSELRILDAWGRKVPAPMRCLDKGQITGIATPAEITAQKAKVARQGTAVIPGTDIQLPKLLPTPPPLRDANGDVPLSSALLYGSLALVAVMLLRR